MENKKEVVVTPLGTVSPYPKDNKNCPGFLIECGDKKILLDCGEGSTRLLDMENDLNNLIVIISHLHKDHYSGLSGLGYASYVYKNLGYIRNKIDVYIPKGDIVTDKKNSKIIEKNIPDFEYLMNYGSENYLNFIPYCDLDKIKYGDFKISFEKNPHQLITHSIKIEINDISIVYSSDTGYFNNKLNTFASNADLLICESTFLRNQNKKSDNHLYAYEAAMIAKEAKVKKLLLTHFWPEIDKQEYVDEAKEIFFNVEAAEEGKKLVLKRG